MADVHVVVGGQFGSEGKGHFTAQLARFLDGVGEKPFIIRTGGPNAGHTALDGQGREWKLRHIPAAAVVCLDAPLGIAAGSEVDGVVLAGEISELELAGIPVLERLSIDSQATLLEQHHLVREQYAASSESTDLVTRIGSTGKGVGAARADRIMREAGIYGGPTDVGRMARDWVDTLSYPVIIEATQGYGLGLHAGFYPKCTSRDVRSIDVLAEVGISPWQPGVDRVITWVVFRPNPIRVAGDSGPLTAETSWEDLGLEPEFTTVTKKMRRVGGWNVDLALDAMAANGGPSPVVRPILMFADYIDRALRDVSDFDDFDNEALDALAAYNVGTPWYGYGTGPGSFAWVDDPYK